MQQLNESDRRKFHEIFLRAFERERTRDDGRNDGRTRTMTREQRFKLAESLRDAADLLEHE